MNTIIQQLVRKGIEVTLTLQDGGIVYNLNSGTKSGMYARELTTGRLLITGRYNEADYVGDLDELLGVFAARYAARGFGDTKWAKLAAKAGYLKEVVVKTTFELK